MPLWWKIFVFIFLLSPFTNHQPLRKTLSTTSLRFELRPGRRITRIFTNGRRVILFRNTRFINREKRNWFMQEYKNFSHRFHRLTRIREDFVYLRREDCIISESFVSIRVIRGSKVFIYSLSDLCASVVENLCICLIFTPFTIHRSSKILCSFLKVLLSFSGGVSERGLPSSPVLRISIHDSRFTYKKY